MVGHAGVKGGVDAFLDHDERQLWSVAGKGPETLDQLRNLVLLHESQLALRHAVPIHHDLVRQEVVRLHRRHAEMADQVCVWDSRPRC